MPPMTRPIPAIRSSYSSITANEEEVLRVLRLRGYRKVVGARDNDRLVRSGVDQYNFVVGGRVEPIDKNWYPRRRKLDRARRAVVFHFILIDDYFDSETASMCSNKRPGQRSIGEDVRLDTNVVSRLADGGEDFS